MKINIFKNSALLFLSLCITVFAQNKEDNIRIIGTDKLKAEKIIAFMQKNIQPLILPDSIDAVKKEIRAIYFKNGFFQFRIDSLEIVNGKRPSAVIHVKEGKRAVFGKMFLSVPDNRIFSQFSSTFTELKGQYFSEKLIISKINKILKGLGRIGYPLSQVEVSKVSFINSKKKFAVNIVLTLIPGNRIVFSCQRAKGNNLTKISVIKREARIKEGTIFNKDMLKKARNNLIRLGFFKSVDEPVIFFVQDSAEILWRVKEGKTSTIDGVLGYHPSDNDREPGYVTGRLQFTFKNFLGTGRFIDVLWEKKDKLSQVMNFGFEEPWVLGLPVSCGIGFNQQVRDSTYIERKWEFTTRYFPSNTFSLSVKGGTRDVFPDSVGVIFQNIPQSNSLFLSAGLEYNTLDYPPNPLHGVRYSTFVTSGRKKISGPDFLADTSEIGKISSYRKFSADVEIVFNIFRNHVAYLGLHGRENNFGKEYVPLSDQIRFGGAATLRGYDEDSFNGTTAAWMNFEYRLVTGHISRIFIFTDSGMYQRREKTGEITRNFKIGYGAGMRIETPLGIMGIDYGLAYGKPLSEGRIHIRVINMF
ncbi:BamA/TamA family outer membrane protein [bacterium]|nr:BamA/TamA family outer membrane protein [bacterium]